MAAVEPAPEQIRKAIETFLYIAYEGVEPPLVVQSQLATLKAWKGAFLSAPVFAKLPGRYSMRLGNKFYPHMKLVMEPSPDQKQWLFRADTHDRHCCPPADAPEYDEFCKLMEKNQRVSERIESTWAEQGLPTFKTYLREDLARRKSEAKLN